MKPYCGGILTIVLSVACVLFNGCTALKDPVKVENTGEVVDLRQWDYLNEGPVIPQNWSWDAGVLWSPETGGRPANLAQAQLKGSPDMGGTLVDDLKRFKARKEAGIAIATASTTLLVGNRQNFALQIGAFPGAHKIWVNGVKIWESGVVSDKPERFRSGGIGNLISVQPEDGKVEIVYQAASDDLLVMHREAYRLWLFGPSEMVMSQDRLERGWRSIQAGLLLLIIAAFSWLCFFRSDRINLFYFALFLASCLVKIVFNVELVYPLYQDQFPIVGVTPLLYLNHALNLVPFPLFTLFLRYQYPEEISSLRLKITTWLTILAEIWELIPFFALSCGFTEPYNFLMKNGWSLPLNVYVVLTTLLLLDQLYQIWKHKRPISRPIFIGSLVLGFLLLIPVIASLFFAVKYAYFLGWGLFFFLLLLVFSLIFGEIRFGKEREDQISDLSESRRIFNRYIPQLWASRFGKTSIDELNKEDRRPAQALLLRLRIEEKSETWLPAVGQIAAKKNALLLSSGLQGCDWLLEGWSEAALACAIEMSEVLQNCRVSDYRILIHKTVGDYRLLDVGEQWVPTFLPFPESRLVELWEKSKRWGTRVLIDASLSEGLVVGGWKGHRRPDVSQEEIEFFEAEESAQKKLKLETLSLFEGAQEKFYLGDREEARKMMLEVLRLNPLDMAARQWIISWGIR